MEMQKDGSVQQESVVKCYEQNPHKKRRCKGEFELPEDISEDDEVLLTSILSVLCAVDTCTAYVVEHYVRGVSYLIRGTLQDENFEITIDDLHFIKTASPLRIEDVSVSRCAGCNQLLVKVLNSKQRVMIKEDSTFLLVCQRKRKACKLAVE